MPKLQLTLALLKPSALQRPHVVTDVIRSIRRSQRLFIVRSQELTLSRHKASKFYEEHEGKFFHNRLVTYMSSGPTLAMCLTGESAIADWRAMLGPTKVYRTQHFNSETIRGAHGISDTRNVGHGSDSELSAKKELQFFFPDFDFADWDTNVQHCYQNPENLYFDEKLLLHRVRTRENLKGIFLHEQ